MAPDIHKLVGWQFGELATFRITELSHKVGATVQVEAFAAAAAAAHFQSFSSFNAAWLDSNKKENKFFNS